LKDVYLVPESGISLISLSRMLRAGWRADMTGSGGQLKRAKETLTWTNEAAFGPSYWALCDLE